MKRFGIIIFIVFLLSGCELCQPLPHQGTFVQIAIGLSYRGYDVTHLNGTINDAEETAEAMRQRCAIMGRPYRSTVLIQDGDPTSSIPTKERLTDLLVDESMRLTPSDMLLISYNGHSLRDGNTCFKMTDPTQFRYRMHLLMQEKAKEEEEKEEELLFLQRNRIDILRARTNLSGIWMQVQSSLWKPWKLNDLNETIGMIRSNLSRLCYRYNNMAPVAQVRELKMERVRSSTQSERMATRRSKPWCSWSTTYFLSFSFTDLHLRYLNGYLPCI